MVLPLFGEALHGEEEGPDMSRIVRDGLKFHG